MIKYTLIGLVLFAFNLASCTKDKAPVSLISSDCPDTIKFSKQILPIFSDNCFSCHANGTSPQIANYSDISSHADKILKSFTGNGVKLMPDGGPQLNDSLINQFRCWINQGKQNN